ncbi:MAG: hypothetical protein AAGA58_08780 [Verrucomicrobiota bacterium]
MHQRLLHPLLLLLPAFAITSCDRGGDRVEITKTRDLSIVVPAEETPELGASDESRLTSLSFDESNKPLMLEDREIGRFIFRKPNTWLPVAESRLRPVNFAFGSASEGEVYVTMLPGDGGGVRPNLDRWRRQMGKDLPMTEEEAANLPQMTFLQAPASLLDISGDFTDMRNPDVTKEDYRLLGVIQSFPGFTISAKMVGPEKLVDDHRRIFLRFANSLKFQVTPQT